MLVYKFVIRSITILRSRKCYITQLKMIYIPYANDQQEMVFHVINCDLSMSCI